MVLRHIQRWHIFLAWLEKRLWIYFGFDGAFSYKLHTSSHPQHHSTNRISTTHLTQLTQIDLIKPDSLPTQCLIGSFTYLIMDIWSIIRLLVTPTLTSFTAQTWHHIQSTQRASQCELAASRSLHTTRFWRVTVTGCSLVGTAVGSLTLHHYSVRSLPPWVTPSLTHSHTRYRSTQ